MAIFQKASRNAAAALFSPFYFNIMHSVYRITALCGSCDILSSCRVTSCKCNLYGEPAHGI